MNDLFPKYIQRRMAKETLNCLLAVQSFDDPIEGKTSLINLMNHI